MRQLFFLTISVAALLFCACTGRGNKFVGKWKPIDGSRVMKSHYMEIKHINGNNYSLVFFLHAPDDTARLLYDEKNNVMTGVFKAYNRTLIYLKDKDHLLDPVLPDKKGSFAVEFERINDNTSTN